MTATIVRAHSNELSLRIDFFMHPPGSCLSDRSRSLSEDGAVIRDAYREHRQIKDLIRQLEAMDDEDAAFSSRMAALREEVQTHAEKEEQRIFPLAERSLPMNDVAFAMDKRRFQLMVQKPAPSVVAMLAFGLVAAGFVMFVFGRRRESWR